MFDIYGAAMRYVSEGRKSEAEAFLKKELMDTPAEWSMFQESDTEIDGYFWSLEEFEAFVHSPNEKPRTKPLNWKLGSLTKALYLLASLAIDRRDWEQARRDISRAIVFEPDHPDLLSELGFVYQQERQFGLALAAYAKAACMRDWVTQSQKARALRGQGSVLIDLQRWDEAETVLLRSLEIEPDNQVGKHELQFARQRGCQ